MDWSVGPLNVMKSINQIRIALIVNDMSCWKNRKKRVFLKTVHGSLKSFFAGFETQAN